MLKWKTSSSESLHRSICIWHVLIMSKYIVKILTLWGNFDLLPTQLRLVGLGLGLSPLLSLKNAKTMQVPVQTWGLHLFEEPSPPLHLVVTHFDLTLLRFRLKRICNTDTCFRFRLHSFLPYYYSINGKCKDGFTYVLYINGGHPPWNIQYPFTAFVSGLLQVLMTDQLICFILQLWNVYYFFLNAPHWLHQTLLQNRA